MNTRMGLAPSSLPVHLMSGKMTSKNRLTPIRKTVFTLYLGHPVQICLAVLRVKDGRQKMGRISPAIFQRAGISLL